jgi:hypothetical protein
MNNQIETRFTRAYGVRHPIALAPMAFVGTAPDLGCLIFRRPQVRQNMPVQTERPNTSRPAPPPE